MDTQLKRIGRHFLMLAIIVVMSVASAGAQGMRMSPESRAKALKDSLALDSTQTAKITAIYKESQDAVMDAMQSGTGDRDAMRATMMEVTKKADDKVKALLNAEQKKKFDEMVKNRPARGPRMRSN